MRQRTFIFEGEKRLTVVLWSTWVFTLNTWFNRIDSFLGDFSSGLAKVRLVGSKKSLVYAFLFVYLGYLGVFALFSFSETANGLKILTPVTSSMLPSIKPGSLVITYPSALYKEKDIIAFRDATNKISAKSRIVIHRIFKVKRLGGITVYVTKGDFNQNPDSYLVKNSDILGKSVIILPYLGNFINILKTLPGFLVFVGIPSFLLLRNEVLYIVDLRRGRG